MVNVKPRTRHLRFELEEPIEDWDDREDEEDFDADSIPICEIIGLRRDIEQSQEWTAIQNARFGRLLKASPAFAKFWRKFIDAGGVTVADFEKWCAGRMRHRLTRGKKHLRLISKKSSPTIRLKIRPQSGNDAA
jgi:hypothetical protein